MYRDVHHVKQKIRGECLNRANYYEKGLNIEKCGKKWWAQPDLNQRPSDYESPALTAELWAQPN
jgi:hypothetical protein